MINTLKNVPASLNHDIREKTLIAHKNDKAWKWSYHSPAEIFNKKTVELETVHGNKFIISGNTSTEFNKKFGEITYQNFFRGQRISENLKARNYLAWMVKPDKNPVKIQQSDIICISKEYDNIEKTPKGNYALKLKGQKIIFIDSLPGNKAVHEEKTRGIFTFWYIKINKETDKVLFASITEI